MEDVRLSWLQPSSDRLKVAVLDAINLEFPRAVPLFRRPRQHSGETGVVLTKATVKGLLEAGAGQVLTRVFEGFEEEHGIEVPVEGVVAIRLTVVLGDGLLIRFGHGILSC